MDDKFARIKVQRAGRVLTATLSDPERRNAIGGELHRELREFFRAVQADEDSDVVILTGAGRAFSAGGDLAEARRGVEQPELFRAGALEGRDIINGILACDKPLIASLNGDAFGLGATVALFCDVVFASERARLCDPHVLLGLVAGDGGAVVWPQLLGLSRAKHHLFTGEPIGAIDAEKYGLVTFVTPPEQLEERVHAYAQRLAAGSQHAIRWTKAVANLELKRVAVAGLDLGLAYEMTSARMRDFNEGVTAFAERRQPKFGGEQS